MFDKIIYLSDNMAHVTLSPNVPLSFNIMNMHVVFQDTEKCILGEIEDIDEKIVKIRFLGEFNNSHFISGTIRKPLLNATVRLINKEEIPYIMGENTNENVFVGTSPLYNNFPIFSSINDLFSNHMAIFGNTGSGKSYGVARILQNVFENPKLPPYKAIFMIFDAYGEYHTAFQDISKINPNFNFKFFSTNEETNGEKLRIPPWLLTVDDLALLLRADSHAQIPIIEKTLRLVRIFSQEDQASIACKDYLIARAIVNIMYNNQTAMNKRNDIFTILNTCQTPHFGIETVVNGVGYTRKLRECFEIDLNGNFAETVLLNTYLSQFLNSEADNYVPETLKPYSLKQLENALDFALITDGILNNPKSYGDGITLKVRLHSIVNSENARFFDYNTKGQYLTLEKFIATLVSSNGRRAQIVNFNLEDIDDSLAKVFTKVFSRMLFEFTKGLENRASIPFNVFLEEAHRYVQNDNDVYLLGYNIFERIAKEGRKYGLIFNLISQRPVELSETVISQCTNFFIFKMSHPRDIDFIKKMLPNINNEIVEKQKSLQPGTCVAFGRAFKVPQIIKMPLPNPAPSSNSCDIVNRWRS